MLCEVNANCFNRIKINLLSGRALGMIVGNGHQLVYTISFECLSNDCADLNFVPTFTIHTVLNIKTMVYYFLTSFTTTMSVFKVSCQS